MFMSGPSRSRATAAVRDIVHIRLGMVAHREPGLPAEVLDDDLLMCP
jgi:hypothetical protein